MKSAEQMLREFNRAQLKARAERKKEVKKMKGLDTVSSKRRRTEKMNRELAAKKRELWDEVVSLGNGGPLCPLCGLTVTFFELCDIGHESSRGIGGGKRDDSKVFLCHHLGNVAQGSQSIEAYKLGKTPEQLKRLCGL